MSTMSCLNHAYCKTVQCLVDLVDMVHNSFSAFACHLMNVRSRFFLPIQSESANARSFVTPAMNYAG